MNLLKTLLLYMSLVYVTTVSGTDSATLEAMVAPTPTPVVTAAPTTAAPTATPTPVATIAITPNPAYGTLKPGDKGDQVVQLQEALTKYGYFTGKIDGVYGGQTRAAVARFQVAHGLSADGYAGKITLTVLYESDEVRYAEGFTQATPTPTSTPRASIAPAVTGDNSAKTDATFVPVETSPVATPTSSPIPTASPAPTPTATPMPSPGPAVLTSLDDETLKVEGTELLDSDGKPVRAYALGNTLFLPLKPILEGMGTSVLTNSSLDGEEIGFYLQGNITRLTYSLDKNDLPVDLAAWKGEDALDLPNLEMQLINGTLYLPSETVETLTDAVVEQKDGIISVQLPVQKEQN